MRFELMTPILKVSYSTTELRDKLSYLNFFFKINFPISFADPFITCPAALKAVFPALDLAK